MAAILSLGEAIQEFVRDGASLALEGSAHLIPFAAGYEIIRQGRHNLTLIRMTPDLIYDQLIGAGCARKLVFSCGGDPGVGSLHRFRDAVENAWPCPLESEEYSHSGIAAAYAAGAARLPFGVSRGYLRTDLPKYNPHIRSIGCPFTGEQLAAIPAIRPDVTIIHAQRADRRGNVLVWGLIGVQKEAALAARRVIATVEEIVETLHGPPNRPSTVLILPCWAITAVCQVRGGAFPSYAEGYYLRDNAFYNRWAQISRDRETFQGWIERHILATKDFDEVRNSLRISAATA